MQTFGCGHPKTPDNSWKKDRNKKSGKQYYGCKLCIGIRNLRYIKANPERKKQRDQDYYLTHQVEIKERVRIYQADTKRTAEQKLISLQRRLKNLAAGLPSDQCWRWNGASDAKGYGRYFGATHPHRAAYELWVGPIPEGWHIHHICRVKACFNPAHLQCLSPSEHHKTHQADVLR